jgi:hypothetical protein
VFYFQDVNEVNGISCRIHNKDTNPISIATMVTLSNNGVISMDATFSTNDVKFHLFTLMVFDAHCIGVPITWIITSWQLVMI